MLKKSAILTLVVGLFLGLGSIYIMAADSKDLKSSKIHLGDSNYAEFVDFLYQFSKSNRLNTQWFGWYSSDEANNWYERSDRDSKFKVNLHLLTEENGYLYFSNGFDEKTINMIVNPGTQKKEWLKIIEQFEVELSEQEYKIETK